MNRFFGPLARRIDAPWKMYPIGVLFGLGFDTATEVALLVLSGTAVASGLPFYAILSLPILFAAGMSLFDTIDGCFMNFAYGWAFARPIRKVYYNITITALSVAAAFLIGTIELLGLLPSEIHLQGAFWAFMANFNINTAGFIIVGMFAITWMIALAVWRFGRIEQRWDEAAMRARQRAQFIPDEPRVRARLVQRRIGRRSSFRGASPEARGLFGGVLFPLVTHADHGGGSGHGHGLTSASDERYLVFSLCLIAIFMLFEIVFAFVGHSLALLADAGHMLTDAGALIATLATLRLARRPAFGAWTFGLKRAEVLSAQANGVTLLVVGALVTFEAIHRLMHPA